MPEKNSTMDELNRIREASSENECTEKTGSGSDAPMGKSGRVMPPSFWLYFALLFALFASASLFLAYTQLVGLRHRHEDIKSRETEIISLNKERDNLTNLISDLQTQKADLQTQIEEFRPEAKIVAKTLAEYRVAKVEHDKLQTSVDTLRGELPELTQQKKDLESEHNRLIGQLGAARKSMQALQSLLEQLQQSRDELAKKIESLNLQASQKQTYVANLAQVKGELEGIEKRKTVLDQEVERNQGKLQGLLDSCLVQKNTLERLKSEVSESTAARDLLNSTINEKKALVAELGAKERSFKQTLGNIVEDGKRSAELLKKKRDELDELHTKQTELLDSVSQLQAQKKQLESESVVLKNDSAELKTTLEKLKQEVSALEAQKNSLLVANAPLLAKKQELENVQQAIMQANKRLQTIEDDANELTREVNNNKSLVKSLNAQCAELETQKAQTSQALTSLRQEKSNLDREIGVLEEKRRNQTAQ